MKTIMVLLVLGIFVLTACATQQPLPQSGLLHVSISDPGTPENTTSVLLSISKITLHNQQTDAWVSLLTTPTTVDLIQLNQEQVMELLSTTTLPNGKYDQIRLEISKVLVTIDGDQEEAKLPSNVLKINVAITVSNTSSLVNLDFETNASIHRTGDGKLIMAPVLHIETYTDVAIDKKGRNIEVKSQKEKSIDDLSMDETGELGKGFGIKPETLAIDSDGKVIPKGPVNVMPNTGKAIFTIKDKPANDSTNDTNQSTMQKNQTKSKPVKSTEGFFVSSLNITFSGLELHSADDSASWIVVSNQTQSFSLLDLTDTEAIFAETSLPVAKYTQMRLNITKAVAIINNQSVSLEVPSGKLRLVGTFNVDANKTSLATLDFIVEKSIKKTNETYVLKPVIKLTTKTGVDVTERTKVQNGEEIRYSIEKILDEQEIDTSIDS